MSRFQSIDPIFLIPSAYGLIGWCAWLAVYLANPIGWNEPTQSSTLCFVLIGVLFALETIRARGSYATSAVESEQLSWKVPFSFGALGLLGIAMHLFVLAPMFGGFSGLLGSILSSSHEIRWENADIEGIGIQLSYFGWIACALWACAALDSRNSAAYRLSCIIGWLVLFTANLAMVDRTRPFWIIVTSVLLAAVSSRTPLRTIRLVAIGGLSITALTLLFVGIAVWVGKIGEHIPGESLARAAWFNIAMYGTAGFAYFDAITTYAAEHTFVPERTLYPIYKALAAVGITAEPPSQILEFESAPYEVNVGTFLTPFYLDGGWMFLVVAVPLVVWAVDKVALLLVRSPSLIARFGWAALCFCQLMAFFTSHLSSTPTWLFTVLAVAAATASTAKAQRESRKEAALHVI